MSLYLGDQMVSGVATPGIFNRVIGQIIESTLPLTDAGLHLLDGSLITGGGIYAGFVNYIANLYGDGTNVPNYFCSESDWQTAVTTYGVCGKFVYDSTNNTVRLPKITGMIEGTTDVTALGDLVQAGLPNITGSFAKVVTRGHNDNTVTGAFTKTHSANQDIDSGGLYYSELVINLDASRSSSVYGNSNTVQPQTIKVLYYIVIATSVKTEIEVNIDEVVTDLNAKADTDLTNINQNGKNNIMAWGMPNYANGVSKSANTSYTADKAGILTGYTYHAGTYFTGTLNINNVAVLSKSENYTSYNWGDFFFIPIAAGDTYNFSVSAGSISMTFYTLRGAN